MVGHVDHGELGQVGRQGIELAQRARSQDALDPVGEFVALEPPVRVVPLERGDHLFTLGVRGTGPLLHRSSIARRAGGDVVRAGGTRPDEDQMPMRCARSSR